MNLLTLEEAAPLTGLSPASLRRLCAEGDIRGAVKRGGVWFVPKSSLAKIGRLRKPKDLVRYSSPYGSPATMARARAEKHFEEDDKRWLQDQQVGNVDESMRRHGPPRIEELP